jgi:hypothetical protein
MPNSKDFNEARVYMKTALAVLEQAASQSAMQKKQESQTQYQQTWGKNIGFGHSAPTATARTLKDLNKMISDEQKKLTELEKLGQPNLNTDQGILSD